MRDSQRSKVYAAEHVLASGQTFDGLDAVKAYLEKLQGKAWYKRRFHKHTFELRDGRGARNAKAMYDWWRPIIVLPRWARTQRTILHEVAHHLTPRSVAGHGPEFCRVYVVLVHHELGAQAARDLKAAWARQGVRWKHKRKLGPAQLAQLRERGKALAVIAAAARVKAKEGQP